MLELKLLSNKYFQTELIISKADSKINMHNPSLGVDNIRLHECGILYSLQANTFIQKYEVEGNCTYIFSFLFYVAVAFDPALLNIL